MREGRAETVLTGQPASRGFAIGLLAHLPSAPSATRVAGTPGEERSALRHAMTEATAQLEALAARADPAGADILEFQIALLDDEDLIEPILQGILEGAPADRAWRTALEREIAAYRDGGDEVLAARAGDLEDLCERVLRALSPAAPGLEQPLRNGQAILAAEDLTPSRFLELDWSHWQGALLRRGSVAGHVALLARARGTPLVVGLGDAFDRLRAGGLAVLDADQGRVIVDPAPATVAAAQARLARRVAETAIARDFLERPALTRTGERVLVAINVDAPSLLDALDPAHTDGVGLTRTEFLFQGTALPDEERQLAAYARVLDWAAGRPVIIRTLDAGGDKPIPGLTLDSESNPFLGLRGLRLSLARPDVFRVQLRALARAAARGSLKVMAPMVTVPAELDAFRRLFREVVDELAAEGTEAALPPLGMMVEVPAAALNAARFAADFLSIGSNDLVQYVMAVARDNATAAGLYDPTDPAVLELIGRVVEAGRAREVEVSLCGDMASDPALVPHLLALGVRRLSVAPAALGQVKAAIAAWPRA